MPEYLPMFLGRCFCLFLLTLHSLTAAAEPTLWLRLQGSNTVGAKLAPALAKGFLEHRGVENVVIQPTRVDNEFLVSGIREQLSVGISIAAHGSATGFQGLATKQADIAMASRPIKSDERELLAFAGDMQSVDAEHTLGIDGVAVLVNRANPLTKLDRNQIARLFSGAIHNWKELGGQDLPVTIYARDERSGTWETFKELVLGKEYTLSTQAKRFESNDELSDSVAADKGGIGFAGLPSIRQAKALAVADGAVNALLPGRVTVATEDYALSRRLFLYSAPQQTTPLAAAFVEFSQSQEGQKIVAASGFVSQNIEIVKQTAPDNAPDFYRNLAATAQRLSVNFRFKEGNSKLDNKALRDIDRLTAFLKLPENNQRRVYLIGFSDIEKNQNHDYVISRFRALAVRAALMQHNVPVFQIEGLGAFMPVASNAEVSAAKNGRVEVWVAPAG